MPRKLLALAAALLLIPAAAAAQTISKSQTGAVGTVVTCTDTSGASVKCVLPMSTPVTATGVPMGSTTSPTVVQGNVAAGATDSGNPVKVGCVQNTTPPTYSNGQRADCQSDTRGNITTAIRGNNSTTAAAVVAQASDGLAADSAVFGLAVGSFARVWNGATWDRNFTCANSAVVNVTAGATTQIVALSASTQVRVCSIAVSMSAAGTAKFVYGTGANCVTGITDLTGAMSLATGAALTLSATAGGSLFRSAASSALCVAAVTGNVVGFITYTQF